MPWTLAHHVPGASKTSEPLNPTMTIDVANPVLVAPADGQTPTPVRDLKPGVYVSWCSIIGFDQKDHAQHGMIGTLTVTP